MALAQEWTAVEVERVGTHDAVASDLDIVAELHRLVASRPQWMRDALCREDAYSGVNFYPTLGEDAEPAKQVCSRCAVRDECADYGMDEQFGIWGGLSAVQRKGLRRRQRPARTPKPRRGPCPACGAATPGRNIYCSNACRFAAQQKHDGVTCPACGTLNGSRRRECRDCLASLVFASY